MLSLNESFYSYCPGSPGLWLGIIDTKVSQIIKDDNM